MPKGKSPSAPIGAPVANHRGEQHLILGAAAHVRLALIPNGAADREGDQRGDHAVVERGNFILADQALERRFGGQRLPAGPFLGRRAAPGGEDQANGHFQFLVQIAAEEVAGGGKSAPTAGTQGLRAAHSPIRGDILGGLAGSLFGDPEESDAGIIGGSDFRLAVFGRADAHLHVRLTRANPNLADQDILES